MRRIILICIAAALLAGGVVQAQSAGWKREAFATIERPLGNIQPVRDGIWRDTSLGHRLYARRVIDESGLPEDRVVLRTTACRRIWAQDARHDSDHTLFLSWPDGRTIVLGLARQTCRTSRSETILPPGSFTFDDLLGSASLDATLGGKRFVVSWATEERDEIEGTMAPDATKGSSILDEPDVAVKAARYATASATVNGKTWWGLCRRAVTHRLFAREATCGLV